MITTINWLRCSLATALFLLLGTSLGAQTALQKTAKTAKGAFLNVGLHQSTFMNTRFAGLVESKTITRLPGFLVEWDFVAYPLQINFSYFKSAFAVDGLTLTNGLTQRARHRGFEMGASMNLFPYHRIFQPFAGAGGQIGSLEVGNGFWSTPDEGEPEVETSRVNMSSAVIKLGSRFLFSKKVGAKVEYKRTMQWENKAKAFHTLSLSFFFKLKTD